MGLGKVIAGDAALKSLQHAVNHSKLHPLEVNLQCKRHEEKLQELARQSGLSIQEIEVEAQRLSRLPRR